MILAAMVVMAMAAEPAQGSANGVWAYGDVSGDYANSFLLSYRSAGRLGASTNAVLGYGVQLDETRRFVPSVRVGAAYDFALADPRDRLFGIGFDAAASFTNLIHEKYSDLRISPVFRGGHHALPVFEKDGMTTQLGFALTHERRFGPVEVSYEPSVQHFFNSSRCARAGLCLVPQWQLFQSLFIEGWALPQVSFALGAWWSVAWGKPNVEEEYAPVFAPSQSAPQHTLGGTASVTWAPFSFGGLALSAHYARALQWSGLTYSADQLTGVLSVWFRTDGKIQRNWLER